ncbi:hypothetical protein AB6C98_20235, partial [Vibrio splendidus]
LILRAERLECGVHDTLTLYQIQYALCFEKVDASLRQISRSNPYTLLARLTPIQFTPNEVNDNVTNTLKLAT